MSTNPETVKTLLEPIGPMPIELVDDVVLALFNRYFVHGPAETRNQFGKIMYDALTPSDEEDSQTSTLVMAGLWGKGLTSRPTPSGHRIFMRYPLQNETGRGLNKNPELAISELITSGEELFEEAEKAQEFLGWFEVVSSEQDKHHVRESKLGKTAVSETEKI